MKRFILHVLLLVPALPFAGLASTVELVCPCTMVNENQTAIVVAAGVQSIVASGSSGALTLKVWASTDLYFTSNARQVARIDLDPLGAGQAHASQARIVGFVTPPDGTYHVRIDLHDDGVLVDSIRMEQVVSIVRASGGAGTPDFGSRLGAVYFPDDPTATMSGSDINIDIPSIWNSATVPTGSLRLQVWATTTADIYSGSFHRVVNSDFPVIDSLGAMTGATNLQVTEALDYDPPAGFDYLHLVVTEAPNQNILLAWKTILVRNNVTFPDHTFTLSGIDVLSDLDGDGVSDFNERRFDTSVADAAEVPGDSTIRVMFVTSPDAAALYPDGGVVRVNHLINYSNQILQNSGVGVQLEAAGVSAAALDDALDNDAVLDLVTVRSSPFATLDTERSASRADLVLVMDTYDAGDGCGIAWLNGENSHGDLSYPDNATVRSVGVVDIDCRDSTLIHEIGHLMGLGHSRRQGSAGAFNWSVGHGVDNEFVSIMAYQSAFAGSVEIDLFSSPSLVCRNGHACGIVKSDAVAGADAALSLDSVRFQVAEFIGANPPSVTLVGDSTFYLVVGSTFIDPGASAVDDGDGDLTGQIVPVSNVDTSAVGTYSVTYSVTDSDGNAAETTRSVVVQAVDTDGDGAPDGSDNCVSLSNPDQLDTDSDSLGDACDDDDDGDGLPDSTEIELGTDPLLADTDADGVPDGAEYDSGFDPLDDTDCEICSASKSALWGAIMQTKDSDGDGLTDLEEIALATSATNSDSDGDGINDGAEVNTHGTDPLKRDTDGDNLSDAEEILTVGTNPLVPDTDGDGMRDDEEVLDGYDPLDIDDCSECESSKPWLKALPI